MEKRDTGRMSRSVLPTALLVGMLGFFVASPAVARVWTDQQGRSMNAKFVRVVGAVGVFQMAGGKVVKVPLAQLCESDQEYIRQELADQGVRVWTDVQGRQMMAKYRRIRDGKVFVLQGQQITPLLFSQLSAADRLWVRDKAEMTGLAEQLPPPAEDETLGESRLWTDLDGNSGEGRLDRVLAGGRVLLAVEGATRVVDVKKLVPGDQDYLRELLEPKGLARLVPPKPRPPKTEVASAAGSPPSPAVALRPRPEPTSSPKAPPSTMPKPDPDEALRRHKERAAERRRETQRIAEEARMSGEEARAAERERKRAAMRGRSHCDQYILACDTCGEPGPPGCKEGDPCPHCSPGVDALSIYRVGRAAGLIVSAIIAFLGFIGGLRIFSR